MAYQVPAFNQPPRQNVDVNPLDATLAADPQAAAVWSSVRGDVNTIVTIAHARLGEIVQALFQQVTQINGDRRLNTATKASDDAQARSNALEAIEALARQAEASRDAISAACAKQLDVSGFISGASSQDTLVMIERTRDAWECAKMVLDSLSAETPGLVQQKMVNLATEAAERGDNFTLSALRRFGEAYLSAKRQGMPHQQFVAQINTAAAPAATPAQRAAMVIQQTLDASWPNIQTALLQAKRYAKDKNAFRVTGLPGWQNLPGINL